ncbi:MAG: winged helix-turn-helix transcriptional regulator [Methanobacteriota archaeon]
MSAGSDREAPHESAPHANGNGNGTATRALQSAVRQQILVLIEGHPGIIISDLARRLDLSHSTTSYHVVILRDRDLVRVKRDGRIVRCYSHKDYMVLATRLVPLLEKPRVRQILAVIQAEPGVRPFRIAKQLSVSFPTVMWHLRKLQEYGAIRIQKENGHYDVSLSPETREALESPTPGPPLP